LRCAPSGIQMDVQRGGNAMAHPADRAVVDGHTVCARCATSTTATRAALAAPDYLAAFTGRCLFETPEDYLTANAGEADVAGDHDTGQQRRKVAGRREPDSPWDCALVGCVCTRSAG